MPFDRAKICGVYSVYDRAKGYRELGLWQLLNTRSWWKIWKKRNTAMVPRCVDYPSNRQVEAIVNLVSRSQTFGAHDVNRVCATKAVTTGVVTPKRVGARRLQHQTPIAVLTSRMLSYRTFNVLFNSWLFRFSLIRKSA